MTNTEKTKEFKVYGSQDGKKACDFKLIGHTRKNEETNELDFKGYKISIETTNNGWEKENNKFTDKKSIMLEGLELVELYATLTNYLTYMKAMRNEPVKHFEIKNQGDSFFVSLKSNNTSHGFKLNRYDQLRLLALVENCIRDELNNTMGIYVNISDYISSMYNNSNNTSKTVVETKEKTNDDIVIEDVKHEHKDGKQHCADCDRVMKENEQKVVDYSLKKFGRIVCYDCQKKI